MSAIVGQVLEWRDGRWRVVVVAQRRDGFVVKDRRRPRDRYSWDRQHHA